MVDITLFSIYLLASQVCYTWKKILNTIKTIKLPLKVVIGVVSEIGDIFWEFPLANVELMLEWDVIADADLADNNIFEVFMVVDTFLVDDSNNVEDGNSVVVIVVDPIFELCVDADSMLFILTESY